MSSLRHVAFARAAERAAHAPEVAEHLRAGGLIAYPTETVYGLGCMLLPDALAELARLKQRELTRPFLLLVHDAAALRGVRWTGSARRLAAAFWPGPLTLALASEPGAFPAAVLSPRGTVAVRLSPHEAVRAILSTVQEPLTSTSANPRGRAPALDAQAAAEVVVAMGAEDRVLIVDGGPLRPSPSSTVVDCSREPPRILRAGAVALEALHAIIPEIDESA